MGYPDGTVQPEGEITRAEACTIFFRLLTDSSRDYYFSKNQRLYRRESRATGSTTPSPRSPTPVSSRAITTAPSVRTSPSPEAKWPRSLPTSQTSTRARKTFTDLAGHWSKSYVELAAGNGWIAGYPDGSFRPDQKITRAETVTMINRVLDRVPAKESRLLSRSIMLTFPDNKPGRLVLHRHSGSFQLPRVPAEASMRPRATKCGPS